MVAVGGAAERPLRGDCVEKLGVQTEAGKLTEHLPAKAYFFEGGFLTPGLEGRYSKILTRFSRRRVFQQNPDGTAVRRSAASRVG